MRRPSCGGTSAHWPPTSSAASPDGELRAYTIAAHDCGLRTWMRSGADGDAASTVDRALDLVHRTWGETGETLVVVARTTTPMWQIVQRIESLQTERGRADTE
ncbi:hypothetical protein [Saccharopolyspora sp. NPDC050642]|uniref:hypothetical protein n=1 Tax=Saccharopolyspora sp. NPDC050642 TaxID=3157099 RepID=UPI0033D1BBDB